MTRREATIPESWTWRILVWAVGLPVILVVVVCVGLGSRYAPGKLNLERLKHAGADPQFEPLVPASIRQKLGDEQCQPLDRLVSIRLPVKSDQDLQVLSNLHEIKEVRLMANADWTITSQSLTPLNRLQNLEKLVIGVQQPAEIFAMLPVEGGARFQCAPMLSGPVPVLVLEPDGLSILKRAPRLTALEIKDTNLKDGWSHQLEKWPYLAELHVKAPVTASDLQTLVNIRSLHRVSWQPADNYSCSVVSPPNEPSAAYWSLSFHGQELTVSVLEPLTRVQNLRALAIACDTLNPEMLAPLEGCSDLGILSVRCRHFVPSDSILDLGKVPPLLSLEINERVPRGQELKDLQRLPMLSQLLLTGKGITPEGYQALSKLRQLRALRLDVGWIDAEDDGVEQLAKLDQLEELDFGTRSWNDSALQIISSMPRLRWLHWCSASSDPTILRNLQSVPAALAEPIKTAIADMESSSQASQPPMSRHLYLGSGRLLLPEPEVITAP